MNIIRKIKNRGFVNLMGEAFNRIVPESLFRFTKMDVYELDLESVKKIVPSEEVVLENVQRDEAKRQELQTATWNSVESSVLDKHLGYSARLKDSVKDSDSHAPPMVGGLWVAKDDYPETDLGFHFMFQPQQAWVYAAYVSPNIRGQNIYQRTLSYACVDLVEQGQKEVLVGVAPWNKSSAYVHKKHSKRKLGRVTAIRFLGTAAIFTSGEIRKSKGITFKHLQHPVEVIL